MIQALAVLLLASLCCGMQDVPKQPDGPAPDAPKSENRETPEPEPEPARVALAVIVHPGNPVTNLTLAELRAILRAEKQFWPDRSRSVLFLRPSSSPEMAILLEHIYRMSPQALQKYWIGKLFAGEIPAKPSIVPNSAAAGARVRSSEGAIAFVLASEVPEGVRVLTIGGSSPGDAEYPLVGPPRL